MFFTCSDWVLPFWIFAPSNPRIHCILCQNLRGPGDRQGIHWGITGFDQIGASNLDKIFSNLWYHCLCELCTLHSRSRTCHGTSNYKWLINSHCQCVRVRLTPWVLVLYEWCPHHQPNVLRCFCCGCCCCCFLIRVLGMHFCHTYGLVMLFFIWSVSIETS